MNSETSRAALCESDTDFVNSELPGLYDMLNVHENCQNSVCVCRLRKQKLDEALEDDYNDEVDASKSSDLVDSRSHAHRLRLAQRSGLKSKRGNKSSLKPEYLRPGLAAAGHVRARDKMRFVIPQYGPPVYLDLLDGRAAFFTGELLDIDSFNRIVWPSVLTSGDTVGAVDRVTADVTSLNTSHLGAKDVFNLPNDPLTSGGGSSACDRIAFSRNRLNAASSDVETRNPFEYATRTAPRTRTTEIDLTDLKQELLNATTSNATEVAGAGCPGGHGEYGPMSRATCTSCSQEMMAEDCTMDDLSGYLEEMCYIPKKRSMMAEMMYT